MKKTIASIAFLASTASVQAIVGPTPGGTIPPPPKPNKDCLSINETNEGAIVGNCDEHRS